MFNIENDETWSQKDIIEKLADKSAFDIVDILNNGNKDDKPNTTINQSDVITGIRERLLTDNYEDITT